MHPTTAASPCRLHNGAASSLPATVGTVLLTGFGPFHNLLVNASWEVVRALASESLVLEDRCCRYIVCAPQKPVQVSYSAVDAAASVGLYGATATLPVSGSSSVMQAIPPLRLVVHVGVGPPGRLSLEARARNGAYQVPDCDGRCKLGGICIPGAPAELWSPLDLTPVCAAARAAGVDARVSTDAGCYLCEYLYFKSLHMAEATSGSPEAVKPMVLFVHIPPIGQPYSLEHLVASLRAVVQACLIQLSAVSAPVSGGH